MNDLADHLANKPFFSTLVPSGTGVVAMLDIFNMLLETMGLMIGLAVGVLALKGHLRKLRK